MPALDWRIVAAQNDRELPRWRATVRRQQLIVAGWHRSGSQQRRVAETFGFRVGVENSAKKLAEREHIKVFASDTIYELVEGVRRELTELLDPQVNRAVFCRDFFILLTRIIHHN